MSTTCTLLSFRMTRKEKVTRRNTAIFVSCNTTFSGGRSTAERLIPTVLREKTYSVDYTPVTRTFQSAGKEPVSQFGGLLPELPFQKVGTDLFEWQKRTYLLVIDNYSQYIVIALLNRPSAAEVIAHMKSVFARHGIPELVMSDNGPQYA